jgi:hypothetical protein
VTDLANCAPRANGKVEENFREIGRTSPRPPDTINRRELHFCRE